MFYLHQFNSLLERPFLAGNNGDMGALLGQVNSHSSAESNASSCDIDMLLNEKIACRMHVLISLLLGTSANRPVLSLSLEVASTLPLGLNWLPRIRL